MQGIGFQQLGPRPKPMWQLRTQPKSPWSDLLEWFALFRVVYFWWGVCVWLKGGGAVVAKCALRFRYKLSWRSRISN